MKIVYQADSYRRIGRCTNRWKCIIRDIGKTIKGVVSDIVDMWDEGPFEKVFVVMIAILYLFFAFTPLIAMVIYDLFSDHYSTLICTHRKYHIFAPGCEGVNPDYGSFDAMCNAPCKEFFRTVKVKGGANEEDSK